MTSFPLPLAELFVFAVVVVLALNELRVLRRDERRAADTEGPPPESKDDSPPAP